MLWCMWCDTCSNDTYFMVVVIINGRQRYFPTRHNDDESKAKEMQVLFVTANVTHKIDLIFRFSH